MRSKTGLLAVAVILVGAGVWAAEPPVAVSPGNTSKLALVESRCPSFSWTAAANGGAYELVVYQVGDTEDASTEVLRQALPAGATSWTPPVGRCLERGGQYAWSVRAIGRKEASDWSAPSLFAVAAGPSEVEFEAAVEVVRSYLAAGKEGAEVSEPVVAATEAPDPAVPGSDGPPVPLAPPAATQLTVDGNIAATSYTGDGENLANVATDAELMTHDHQGGGGATVHHKALGSVGANDHHVPTVDTFVTNKDDHDHLGGDGRAVLHSSLLLVGASDHHEPTVDTDTNAGTLCAAGEYLDGDGVCRSLSASIQAEIECSTRGSARFTDCGNGTVLDNNTGLLWLKDGSCADLAGTDAFGQGNWTTAQSAAAALSDGTCGLTDGSVAGDWRQPTIWEWCSAWEEVALFCPPGAAPISMIDFFAGPPRIPTPHPFSGVITSAYHSATNASLSLTWTVNLDTGGVFVGGTGNTNYVWPVRGGQ